MSTVNISDLLQRSISERIQLAADLWDSIAADPDALPVTEAERREVLRRSEAHRRDPGEVIPLEESLERIADANSNPPGSRMVDPEPRDAGTC